MTDTPQTSAAMPAMPGSAQQASGVIFTVVIVVTGVTAGLGGTLLIMLLHFVQHIAFDYDLGSVPNPESFLEGVTAASPPRRAAALTACGLVAGIGWWSVFRFGKPLVSIKAAVGKGVPGPRMPFLTTTAHALLQIITVALGSPLGREVAPREIGAMLATRIASRAGLTPEEVRIVIACGAGAGLAAVYNVPLGGAAFVLEVLLGTLAPRILIAALASSVIASTVAWIGLGDVPQYLVPPLGISASLVAGSIVVGPVCGMAAYAFRKLVRWAGSRTPLGWKRITWSLAVFVFIGLLATLFPQLPGNGKGPSQLGFDGDLGLRLAIGLLALKVLAIALSLRAGAAGGVLTPSLTLGALLATIFSYVWNLFFPSVHAAAFAITGAAAFLASSMAMPWTAIILTIEFTRVSQDMWVPMVCAVTGSAATFRVCTGGIPVARMPERKLKPAVVTPAASKPAATSV
jgi:H+/Cl- antiporter ClcA